MKEPDLPHTVVCVVRGENAYQVVQTRQYPGFVWVVAVCTGYNTIVGSKALLPQTAHACPGVEPGFTLLKSPGGWLLAVDPMGDRYNNSLVSWHHVVACPFCGQRLGGDSP